MARTRRQAQAERAAGAGSQVEQAEAPASAPRTRAAEAVPEEAPLDATAALARVKQEIGVCDSIEAPPRGLGERVYRSATACRHA